MSIDADRNLVAVMSKRIKHGGSILDGDARWAFVAAVDRVLADHAVLRGAAGVTDSGEVVQAACELIDRQAEGKYDKAYTYAFGRLRSAVQKLREG